MLKIGTILSIAVPNPAGVRSRQKNQQLKIVRDVIHPKTKITGSCYAANIITDAEISTLKRA